MPPRRPPVGALDKLEEHGPGLRRPVVGNIVGSRLSGAEIELHDLREHRGVTQTALAAALGIARPRVSRIEHDGEDLRLSTVQRYVEALGGQLKIIATFDDGDEITLRSRAA
ncbi:MAG: XRE family transcriptional regulator [Patulibacter sp.]